MTCLHAVHTWQGRHRRSRPAASSPSWPCGSPGRTGGSRRGPGPSTGGLPSHRRPQRRPSATSTAAPCRWRRKRHREARKMHSQRGKNKAVRTLPWLYYCTIPQQEEGHDISSQCFFVGLCGLSGRCRREWTVRCSSMQPGTYAHCGFKYDCCFSWRCSQSRGPVLLLAIACSICCVSICVSIFGVCCFPTPPYRLVLTEVLRRGFKSRERSL